MGESLSKKVIIFGAGVYGCRFLSQNDQTKDGISVIGFLDNDEKLQGCMLYGKYPCYPPESAISLEYDSIVIANATKKIRTQMLQQLLDLGVSQEHIEFFSISKAMAEYMNPRVFFICGFSKFVFEQGISGNVAECGVNAGSFAQHINRYFFNKRLYLFDTFEGFALQDIEVERELKDINFLSGKFNQTGGFNHSVDIVMSKMSFPNQVIIKKGWVPETFAGIDDTFCFVNLDMDLYQPIFAAIKFFWDRMSVGGVLLLHDYHLPELPGVKKAVNDFESELGRKVTKLPIDDISIALIKS